MSELGLRKVLSNDADLKEFSSKRSKTERNGDEAEVSDKSDTDAASEGNDDRLQRMSNAIRTVIEVALSHLV